MLVWSDSFQIVVASSWLFTGVKVGGGCARHIEHGSQPTATGRCRPHNSLLPSIAQDRHISLKERGMELNARESRGDGERRQDGCGGFAELFMADGAISLPAYMAAGYWCIVS
ncbi:hypothetical protein B0T26DRAFT_703522 [Lasiosphaeria miniovina]|uniref:Uncharacterized protein n=1 Tax=Lasiosphaeria miniovina TaxID=1954250 RepID=A0AA40AV90_9PEZI|nr:uncharacterized protein B0T26DRAFT_703522 [Lasiosphaeria miniovina]KAK0722657.1 hypothetical protein B0T26DRAFT_703522 [Lasiosphaeria miniovina]